MTTVVLALKQSNTEYLTRLFWSVSDPRSLQYGQFLSLEEVADIVRPHPQHVKVTMVLGHAV